MTVLFTDMVGSTELLSRLGDERFDGVRRAHIGALRDALAAHDGSEVKSTGDGLMAVFASASDAASAAVTMQQVVERLNQRNPDEAAGLKVGISVGDATSEDGDWFGVPVVEAARLCDAAAGGKTFATEIVRMLAGNRGGHRFDSMGMTQLKGLPEPVGVCEIRWESSQTVTAPLPALFSCPEPIPFAGRTRAQKTLRESWDAAIAGERRVTLIAGEPGIGKTRLIGELARAVHEIGAVVLAGRCDPEMDTPLGPWSEALDHLARHAPDELMVAHVADWGDALSEVSLAVAARVGVSSNAPSSDPEAGRRRLFAAAIDLVDRVAALHPVLLVLDDLHWADASSLLLLRNYVQHAKPGNVLIVGTYRDTDLDRKHPLSGVLADFRRETGVERIALRGLDGDELLDYLTSAGGRELTDDGVAFAHQLSDLTAGNPFFVSQMLRHLSETNALVQQEGRWIAGPVDPSGSGVPEGVREVIGRRLSALDPRADHLFSVAAAIGSEFDLATLAKVADVGEGDALDMLDDGLQRSLLVEEPGRYGVYRFAHALVRQTLLEELSTTRRLQLHRAIASTVAAAHPERVEVIAFHYSEAAGAGMAADAVEWSTRAADRAVQRLAYESSVDWYAKALESESLLPVDAARHGHLLMKKARAETVFDSLAAKADLLAVADLARELDDAELFAEAAVVYGGWTTVWDQLDDPQREPLIREALQRLPDADSELRVRVLLKLRDTLQLAPAALERRDLCDEALAMARRLGDPNLITEALFTQFLNARGAAGIAEREAWLTEMETYAGLTDARRDGAVAFAQLMLLRIKGELEPSRAALPRTVELVHKAGLDASYLQWSFDITDHVAHGRFVEAKAVAYQTDVERLGDLGALVIDSNLGSIAIWCNGLSSMVDQLVKTEGRFPELMSLYAMEAYMAFAEGRSAQIPTAIEHWLDVVPLIPEMLLEHVSWQTAELLWSTNSVNAARRMLDVLKPLELRGGTWFVAATDGIFGPAEYTIGVLQLAAGEAEQAVRSLREAVASAQRSGALPWIAGSRSMLAHALAAAGAEKESRTEAALACIEADALGMDAVTERAKALLATV